MFKKQINKDEKIIQKQNKNGWYFIIETINQTLRVKFRKFLFFLFFQKYTPK